MANVMPLCPSSVWDTVIYSLPVITFRVNSLWFRCPFLPPTAIAVVELIGVEAVSFLGNKIALFIRGGVAAFMAFVWLVCFGVLVAAYNDNSLAKANLSGSRTPAQAASAFSFFSVCLWVSLHCGIDIK